MINFIMLLPLKMMMMIIMMLIMRIVVAVVDDDDVAEALTSCCCCFCCCCCYLCLSFDPLKANLPVLPCSLVPLLPVSCSRRAWLTVHWIWARVCRCRCLCLCFFRVCRHEQSAVTVCPTCCCNRLFFLGVLNAWLCPGTFPPPPALTALPYRLLLLLLPLPMPCAAQCLPLGANSCSGVGLTMPCTRGPPALYSLRSGVIEVQFTVSRK